MAFVMEGLIVAEDWEMKFEKERGEEEAKQNRQGGVCQSEAKRF